MSTAGYSGSSRKFQFNSLLSVQDDNFLPVAAIKIVFFAFPSTRARAFLLKKSPTKIACQW